jgi:hypothetical protein
MVVLSFSHSHPHHHQNGAAPFKSFAELIAPFRRLRKFTLPELRAWYDENPVGFEYICGEALRHGKNPEAFLVWLGRKGEHRYALDELPPGRAVCGVCETGAGRHSADCPVAHPFTDAEVEKLGHQLRDMPA